MSGTKKVQLPLPINDEIMKGVMVDGIGLRLGPDYVILDGAITPPRSEKPLIVTRMLVPAKAIPLLIKILGEAQEKLKEGKIKEEVVRG